MSWLKSKGIWIVALLVLASIGGVLRLSLSEGARRSAPHYQTAAVDRGRVVAKVTASGALSALVTVQVGSQVSGRLSEVLVDFNSTVKKGQMHAEHRPALFEAAPSSRRTPTASRAGANLAKAKVAATDADRQYARAKGLTEKGLSRAAGPRLGRRRPRSRRRRGSRRPPRQVTVAAAAEHQARVNLDYTTIVVAHRRRRHLAQRGPGPDRGRVAVGAHAVHHRAGPRQDAGRHQRRRVRRRQADRGHGGHLHGRCLPGRALQGHGAPDPQRAPTVQNVVTYDAVHRRRQRGPAPQAGHDRERHLRDRAEAHDVLRVPNAALRFRPTAETWAPAQAAEHPRRRGSAARRAGRRGRRGAPAAGLRRGCPGGRRGCPTAGTETGVVAHAA